MVVRDKSKISDSLKEEIEKSRTLKREFCVFDGLTWMIGRRRFCLQRPWDWFCKIIDGKTSDYRLRKMFEQKTQSFISRREFYKVIKRFKTLGLLFKYRGYWVSRFNKKYRKKQEQAFIEAKIRPAVYAGYMYPHRREILKQQLRICFDVADQQLDSLVIRRKKILKGVIVPHSNLVYSGLCAASAYKTISISGKYRLFVLFAPDHSFSISEPFSVLAKDFITPLGIVHVDRELIDVLSRESGFNIYSKPLSHYTEHAIEIQLPFIQYIHKYHCDGFKILPILCCSNSDNSSVRYKELQENFLHSLHKNIERAKQNSIIIATGDLCHANTKCSALHFHQLNSRIIGLLKSADPDCFEKEVKKERYSMCGYASFYPFLKFLKGNQGNLLNYSWTSKTSVFDEINKGIREYKRYIDKIMYDKTIANQLVRKRIIDDNMTINIGYLSMAFFSNCS